MSAEHAVDRSGWAPGAWDDEPEDVIEWESEGVPCLMVRQKTGGNWCGYVHVPAEHPWSAKAEHKNIGQTMELWVWRGPADMAECHGGVTYSSRYKPLAPHPKTDGMWVGFDCAHSWDHKPSHGNEWQDPRGRYCTRDYVRSEVEGLAQQAREGADA